jgi:aerobic-type carbon monoxide dehydrogenase small subunit (CoxS/CutS family)
VTGTTPNLEGTVQVVLHINGEDHQLRIDPRTTLLDCIRETVALTGTKKGCDHGQCGACTVHVNGRRVTSCLSLALLHDGHEITTIEGLGTPALCIRCKPHFSPMTATSAGIARPARSCRQLRSSPSPAVLTMRR